MNPALKRTISVVDTYYEIVYIVAFVLYYYTQITVLSGAPFFFVAFLKCAVSLVLPVIVIIWLARNLDNKKREVIIGFLLIIIMMIAVGKNGYAELKYLALFAAGSIGVNHKKVIKCTVITACIAILCTFIYTFAINPSINNVYVIMQRIRSSMGLNYPTDAASLVLFACLGLMILGKACPIAITFTMSVLSLLLSVFYFDSVTSSIISAMLCFSVIGIFVYESKFTKFVIPKRIKNLAKPVLYALIPFLTALQLILAHFYGEERSWASMADELLHKRVSLTYKGLTEHGITLLGENIVLFGKAAPGIQTVDAYNFIDSSYINILIRYGLMSFLCILFMWIIIQRKAVKHGNMFIILATVLISIHSFEEHHFAEIAFNPLLYMPFSDEFDNGTDLKVFPVEKSYKRKMIIAVVSALAIMAFSPYIFSETRTIYDSMIHDNVQDRLDADSNAIKLIIDVNEYPVYADVLTGEYAKKFKGIKRSALAGDDLVRRLDCTIITNADTNSPAFFSRGMAYAQISDYSAVYTTDSSVIEALRDAGYHVAGYYYREICLYLGNQYTSDSIPVSSGHVMISGKLTVDSLKPVKGEVAKVILFSSDGSVERVYTSDDVSEEGIISYELTLNTHQDAVSLEVEAIGKNEVVPLSSEVTDGGTKIPFDMHLCRMGTSSMKVYSGKYTLKTKLELANYDSIHDDVVGTLTLLSEFGTTVSKDIYLRDFSEKGTLDYETVFDSKGDSYSFILEPINGADLYAESLRIAQTPDYDIISFHNKDGLVIRSEYYDLDGNRVLSNEGVFAYEYEYDKHGNTTVVRYYDIDNSPVISAKGYAEVHRGYDKLKHLIHESYYREDGTPLVNQMGYAAFDQEVDAYGRPTYIRYYDGEGKPTITGYKYAAVKKKYNENDQVIYEAYFDENGNRLSMEYGYSGCRYDYDEVGHQSKIIYLDDEDEPVITKLGYAEINKEYDDKGNVVVESYYDTDGELMLLDRGYASIVRIFDDYGDNTSVLYFGLETTSYIEIRREYDDRHRVIYEGKFDNNGNGLILNGEYSAYRQEYDGAGNVSSIKYYGTDGKPMLIGGDFFECRKTYDKNERVIYETFWGINGEEVTRGGVCHGMGYGYDDNNNRNVIKYYDADGNPVADPSGVFEIRRTFDEDHNIVSESHYDLKGKLID